MGESVLLLVTILLVLIAAATLLIGIFGNNLALIFVSIGASVIAALVLAVLSQMSKRKIREEAVATGPAPLPVDEPLPAPEPVTAAEPVLATVGAAATTTTAAVGVPIQNYDSLRVNQIIPRLDSLDLDGLEAVAQHEEDNKNRTSILNRIDQLMDELEASSATPTAVEDAVTVVAESGFPIPNFDSLSEAQIVASLDDLDADELEQVAEYEETHANRDSVLDAIDDRLDELEGIAAPAATKTATRTATKKTTAKKSTARKDAAAPVRTAAKATKKAASTASRAPAKATKKAATKSAATRPPAKATKKAATKSAATVKKAGAVKKATATKKAAAKKSR